MKNKMMIRRILIGLFWGLLSPLVPIMMGI